MEGDAGASRLNPTGHDITPPSESPATESTEQDEDSGSQTPVVEGVGARRPGRLGRGWLAAVCALLVVAAAGIGVGGYLALRANQQAETSDRAADLALARAKECVAATQAPDIAALTATQSKIVECGTGAFAMQASLYASVLVDAYQAANVSVKVSDLRAAVEKHNDDGSIDELVAVRVMVTNSQVADQEQGYRLRVQMAPDAGIYKIARLDQVTS